MKTKLSLLGLFLFSMIFNLQAQILYSVPSNGGAPAQTRNSQTVTDWLHYDGDNYTRIGNQNVAYTIGTYVKLTSTLLNPHVGRQIEELQFYIGDITKVNGDLEIRFYSDLSSTPVYTQTVATSTLTSEDWNTVVLTTPYQISNANNLYVGYYVDMQPSYFAGADDGSNFVTNVNYFLFNGTQYENGAAGLPYNWNIRAGVGGATSTNDCGTSDVNIGNIIMVGNTNIEATLVNYGATTLNSVDFNYQVDNGAVVTENISGLSLATGQSHTYTFTTPWNATSGNHTLKVYTSNFNGSGNDDIAGNDAVEKDVFVVNEIFPKTVVFEEGTGTWCGWCVRGIVGLKNMAHYHNDGSWIGIAVHNGDPMQVNEYNNGLDIHSFPSGRIDRSSNTTDPGYDDLEDAYTIESAKTPLAKVDIPYVSWSANRHIFANVETKFALDLNNVNYKLSLIIVENGVTGTSSGYNQHNYYSSSVNNIDLVDWEGTNYKNLPDPIPAAQMVYNHVGRAIIGGFNGVNGSLPANVVYNTPYSYMFSFDLPANIDENNVELVAIIIDGTTGEIVNGKQIALDTTAGVDDVLNKLNVKVYPNPASDFVFIDNAENIQLKLFSITGRQIVSKKLTSSKVALPVENLDKGVYFIKLSKDDISVTKKIIIK